MLMKMGVRLAGWVTRRMRVLMVLVVHMGMGVSHRLVLVLMLVMLGEMQQHPDAHENAGNDEPRRYRLAQCDHSGGAAEERRG